MRKIALVAFCLLSPGALAQQVPLQGGPWTVGHVPIYNSPAETQPILQDGGGAAGGGVGATPSEIGITEVSPTNTYPAVNAGNGPNNSPFCTYDGPTTGQYHYLCLAPNSSGGGLISYGAGGGASQLPLQVLINGVLTPFGGGSASLVLGTTPITGSPVTGVLVNNAGILGALTTVPYTIGGTGLTALGAPSQCLTTNPGATGMAWANCSTAGGTVTSVGLSFSAGIISVSGSPITSSGTFSLTVAGVSGGVPYFSSSSGWGSSAQLAASAIMVGGGSANPPATIATGANVLTALGFSTNVTNGLTTGSGSLVPGDCLTWGPGIQDAGGPCTVSGGGIALPATVSGTANSGGVLYLSSTTSMASSATLAANSLVKGGGPGVAPSTITTGAGVISAIAIATGSSGGLTTQNGAIITGNCLKWGPGVTDAGSVCGGGGALTIGVSTISGGTPGLFLYNNAGVLGNQSAVTSVGAGCGTSTGGTTITGTGSIVASVVGTVQTGSSYAFQATDCGNLVVLSNASAQTPTLNTATLSANYFVNVENVGAGTQTITPSSGYICKAAQSSLALTTGQGIGLVNDGTNWQCTGGPYVVTAQLGSGINAALLLSLNGSGALVGTTSATLVTPALGIIASGNLAAGTGYLATALAAIPANTFVANVSGGGASPTAASLPSCSANGSLLQYLSGTGLQCVAAGLVLPTPGSGATLSGTSGYYVCTTTCSVVLPVPSAGAQFCVRNDSTVTTVITIAAVSTVLYEKTTYNGYGTASTGTMVSGGALGDKICLIGRDATHWLIGAFIGTWVNS